MVMEPFPDHISFVQPSIFAELERDVVFNHVSLHELFQFVSSTFHGEEVLQAKDTPLSWDPIINKASEVEYQLLVDNSVPFYSLTSRMLMPHLVKNTGTMIFGQQRGEVDIWIR